MPTHQLIIHELLSSGSPITSKRRISAVRDAFIYTLSYAQMHIHLCIYACTLADNPRTPFVGLAHHKRTSHPWLIHIHTWATQKCPSNQLTIHELLSPGSQITNKRRISVVRDAFIYTLSYAEMPIHRLTIHELLSSGSQITNERLISMAQHVQVCVCVCVCVCVSGGVTCTDTCRQAG